jgi:Helix-turn-helix domain
VSVQAISWVIENSSHKSGSFVVLLMIANHAHSDGTGAFPSLSTLANESRLTVQQVANCLKRLEASGELHIERGKGPYRCNLYSLPGVFDTKKILVDKSNRHSKDLSIDTKISSSQILDKPSLSVKEEPKEQKEKFVLPDWIPVGSWNSFVEMRNRVKKPLTEHAKHLAVLTLDRMRASGEDVAELIDRSTFHCWLDFYPKNRPLNGGNNGHKGRFDLTEEEERILKEDAEMRSQHGKTSQPFRLG